MKKRTALCFALGSLCSSALFAGAPWIHDNPVYIQGVHGEALVFMNRGSRLFLKTPGFLNTETGTLQFRLALQRDCGDLRGWATQIAAPSDRPETGIVSFASSCSAPNKHPRKDGKSFFSIAGNSVEIQWKKGEWHAIAYTWSPEQNKLYVDGRLVATKKGKKAFPYMPEYLAFGGGVASRYGVYSESALDDIELSDCVRPEEYIRAFARGALPEKDEHTLAFHDCDRNSSGFARSTENMKRNSRPVVVAQSGFFTNNSIFKPEDRKEIHFSFFNTGNSAEFLVTAKIRDAYGKKFSSEQLYTVTGGALEEKPFPLKVEKNGWYEVVFSVKRNGVPIYSAERTFVILPSMKGAGGGNSFLGNHLSGTRDVLFNKKLGISWQRDMGSFAWETVEPDPGKWQWMETDIAVQKAKENGFQILAVLGLPPVWAKKGKSAAPADLEKFCNYVERTVSRYKNSVKYWELINEPDWIYGTEGDLGKNNRFAASPSDYLALLKAGYETIKKADSKAIVVSGGFVPHPHLIQYLAKHGGGRYFDVLGMHRYRSWADLERYAKLFPGKEIWQTEHLNETPEITAGDVFMSLKNGFTRTFFFDAVLQMVYFTKGLFNAHGWSPQKPVFALAQCAAKLEGKERAGELQFPRLKKQVFGYLLDKGKSTQTVLVYSMYTGPLKISFQAEADGVVTVSDLMGASESFALKKGEKRSVPIRTMTFLEGAVDLSSLNLEPEEGGQYLRNADFKDLVGDIGMDGKDAMKPAEWHIEREGGRVFVRTEEGKNVIRFQNPEGRNVRMLQFASLARPGWYELSGEYRLGADGNAKTMPYLQLSEQGNGKNQRWKGVAPLEVGKWKKFSVGIRVEKPDSRVLAMAGVIRKGSVDLRNLRLMRKTDPEKRANTLFFDCSNSAKLKTDFSNLPEKNKLNGGSLILLQSGIREYKDILFSIPEQLKHVIAVGKDFSDECPRVVVNSRLREIHILNTALLVSAKKGEPIGKGIVRYADGTAESFEFLRGQGCDDWFSAANNPDSAGKIALPEGETRDLFVLKWNNPHPGKIIQSLSFLGSERAFLLIPAVSGIKEAKRVPRPER